MKRINFWSVNYGTDFCTRYAITKFIVFSLPCSRFHSSELVNKVLQFVFCSWLPIWTSIIFIVTEFAKTVSLNAAIATFEFIFHVDTFLWFSKFSAIFPSHWTLNHMFADYRLSISCMYDEHNWILQMVLSDVPKKNLLFLLEVIYL